MNTLKRFVWIGLAVMVVAAASPVGAYDPDHPTDKFRWSPISVHPFFSGNYVKDPITMCPWNARFEFYGEGWHKFRGVDAQSYQFILSLSLVENLEIGALLPLNVIDQEDGSDVSQGSNKSIGDVGAYAKYRLLDLDWFDAALGFEYASPRQQDPQLTLSNGTIIEARNGFTLPPGTSIVNVRNGAICGTNDVCGLGFSEGSYMPFGSIRASFLDSLSAGAHLGYMFYGDPLGQVLNWHIEGLWAPIDWLGLRLEFDGFNQTKGASQDIISFAPGVDFVFDRFTFRVGGAKGVTDDAADWAAGGGIALQLGETCEAPPPPPPPPAPAAAPPPPPMKKRIVLRGVNFDFDKSNIRPVDVPVLEEAVATLKEEGMPAIIATGYTDAIGTDAYNLRLSDRRAASVKAWLVDHGVPASKIETRGMGEADPVATNETADGRAQNRRTELKIVE